MWVKASWRVVNVTLTCLPRSVTRTYMSAGPLLAPLAVYAQHCRHPVFTTTLSVVEQAIRSGFHFSLLQEVLSLALCVCVCVCETVVWNNESDCRVALCSIQTLVRRRLWFMFCSFRSQQQSKALCLDVYSVKKVEWTVCRVAPVSKGVAIMWILGLELRRVQLCGTGSNISRVGEAADGPRKAVRFRCLLCHHRVNLSGFTTCYSALITSIAGSIFAELNCWDMGISWDHGTQQTKLV